MKKSRFLILLLAILFALAGCGDSEVANGGSENNQSQDGDGGDGNDGDGDSDGPADGDSDGPADGDSDGPADGDSDGPGDGDSDGPGDGDSDGPGDDPELLTECQEDFGAADACGGNPEGSWNLTDSCTDFDLEGALTQFCPQAAVSSFEYQSTGTLVVLDGIFARTTEAELSAEISFPINCAIPVGGCDGVAAFLEGAYDGADVTCTTVPLAGGGVGGGGNCECILDAELSETSSGSYTTNDGIATVNGDQDYYYCVDPSGSALMLRPVDSALIPFVEYYTR